LDHGVDVCWLIDPVRRTAEILDAAGASMIPADGVLEHPVVPGFHVAMVELFAVLD
jgi:hypothetical protein